MDNLLINNNLSLFNTKYVTYIHPRTGKQTSLDLTEKNRGTIDPLIQLETFLREALINKEHVVAVIFDLEKANDMMWKHGILSDLHDINLREKLPICIQHFSLKK